MRHPWIVYFDLACEADQEIAAAREGKPEVYYG